jgi:hypothetical protein
MTAVGSPMNVTLPSLGFVSKVLGAQLSDIGMSQSQLGSEVENDFDRRDRNESDPRYSLDTLRESPSDILGHYWTDLSSKAEIALYVDSCSGASTDLSISLVNLIEIVLIHELAHHATAWATIHVDIESPDIQTLRYTWMDYNNCYGGAWTSVHEFLAQALAFTCIVEHHKGLLRSFRTLSRNQPTVYRTWEVLDAFNQNEVVYPRFVLLSKASFWH